MPYIFFGRQVRPRTLIIILVLNSILQTALLWWPDLFGRAHGFLGGFCLGIALGFGIGALLSDSADPA